MRACPECSHRDTVVAPTDAAATWRRVEARQRVQLASSLLVLEVEAWLAGRTAEGPTASAA